MLARKVIAAVAMSLLLCALPISQAAPPSDGTVQLIKEAILATGDIKAGSLRQTVERSFVLDGGTQTRQTSRYVFKKCHFIKIDVTFERGDTLTSGGNSPRDKVVGVSKPYLEYPTLD
jgi:hypothetical protein